MGIRKSTGKNKKSKRRPPPAAMRRQEVQRGAARDRRNPRPPGMR